MLVEIHMIQNHAPSNLNRDDTGSPKDCLFGGVLRARISSQCLKSSIRGSSVFKEALDELLGIRTRKLPSEISKQLRSLGCNDEQTIRTIAIRVAAFGKKDSGTGTDSSETETDSESEIDSESGNNSSHSETSTDLYPKTRQLIFLSLDEIRTLGEKLKAILDNEGLSAFDMPKETKKSKKDKSKDLESRLGVLVPRSVDIALFGRMTTSKLFEDVQATMQVAHAISTHKITRQFDYYTGVDDLNKAAEETGAGMIGDIEFNSATYYKYFSLDWDSFVKALGGDVETARKALGAFIRAAALSTPTGKQNTFAAHNLPDAILVEIKAKKQPVSYANAFVKPVRADAERDIVGASIAAFSDYRTRLCSAYGIKPEMTAYLAVREDEIAGAEKVGTLDKLIEATIVTLDGRTVGQ